MLENLQKQINRYLKAYDIQLSESAVSMVLGAVVVIVVGLLAYNYFRTNQPNVTPAEVSTTNEEATASGELGASRSSVALPATHTVVAGENLWSISEKYFASGYNFVDIAQANDLANSNYIEVGQKLTIPKVEIRKPVVATAAMYPVITDSKIEGNSYTVTKGDYLWQIALRAYGDGFKWVEIARANNLVNPDVIHVGNVLSIPR